MKNYRILSAETPAELAAMVTEQLNDGWVLAGGVAVCAVFRSWENERKGYTESETDYTYAQAMTHDDAGAKP